MSIDEKEVVYYDFVKGEGFTCLKGSETLNAAIKNDSPISRVKYVNSNSILADNTESQVFKKFMDFVEHMLLFYSLDSRGYEGFMNGNEGLAEGIVNSGKVDEFKEFLKENDIVYDLYACEVDGRKAIYCRFENRGVDFFKIASNGTRSLALFYYWYIRMQKASFVFIDEFDAFYHFELSESVEKRLREIKGVQIFTTTYNTDLMSNDLLRPDCYFILKDNKIKVISELTDKDYKAFIVEGEVREPLIIDNISKVFFAHANFKIITLPAGQNIYMLWKKLKEDDFSEVYLFLTMTDIKIT